MAFAFRTQRYAQRRCECLPRRCAARLHRRGSASSIEQRRGGRALSPVRATPTVADVRSTRPWIIASNGTRRRSAAQCRRNSMHCPFFDAIERHGRAVRVEAVRLSPTGLSRTRSKIERRRLIDREHVSDGCRCCQRLLLVPRPRSCASLNSRDVLDRDNRLVGEGAQQLDLASRRTAVLAFRRERDDQPTTCDFALGAARGM